ncbi:MAG: hypothetical protein J6C85_02005 [Alphaproteobacteria bacterium]|nr:hypothetical protein [Alphaproteobacteria bacterium]
MKKIIVGYSISLALVVCYLVFFEFSFNVFLPSLAFVLITGLDIKEFISKNKKLGLMWLIFNFGLFGLISSLLSFTCAAGNTLYVIGIFVAGVVCCLLQTYIEEILNLIQGGVKVDDAFFPCVPLTALLFICIGISDFIRSQIANEEVLTKQLAEEKFVPLEFYTQEIHNGRTIYFYEAKGKTCYIKPNEVPQIRKAGKNFKAKIVLGNYYSGYGAYKVEKIEFEKKK